MYAACVDKAGALIYYLPAFPSRNHFISLAIRKTPSERELFDRNIARSDGNWGSFQLF